MALNVQFLDIKSDDFSPTDLIGRDKYRIGSYINESLGYGQHSSPYLGQNQVFNQIYANDQMWNQQFLDEVEVLEYIPDDGKGVIEYWNDISDMTNIGQVNHLNLMTYAPIRKLATEGRIEAFDYDPFSIPEEDIIGRMISNGRADVEDDGSYELEMMRHSDDLDYTDKQLAIFEHQRRMVDIVLRDTDLDPTNTKLERF